MVNKRVRNAVLRCNLKNDRMIFVHFQGKLPGSSPSGSREFEVGTASASLEKYIFNYRYIEKLETNSVVGKLVEKKRLNNLVYVE